MRELEVLKYIWWKLNKYTARDCFVPQDENVGVSLANIGGIFMVVAAAIPVCAIGVFIEYK